MTAWVLILSLIAGYGVALTTTTFQTQEACEAAGKQARQRLEGTLSTVRYVCVPGGAAFTP